MLLIEMDCMHKIPSELNQAFCFVIGADNTPAALLAAGVEDNGHEADDEADKNCVVKLRMMMRMMRRTRLDKKTRFMRKRNNRF